MAPKGPSPGFLLLLAICLALASGQSWNLLNDIFRKNHVNFPKLVATNDNAYCNRMMWDRAIYLKYTNTFINEGNTKINKVCTDAGGTPSGINRQESKEEFRITVCTFNPWTFRYTGISATAKIVIACSNGLPAFFVMQLQEKKPNRP